MLPPDSRLQRGDSPVSIHSPPTFTYSLTNKLLILLPVSLALSLLAPQTIMPLLMLGGVYLCYEGAEKIHELIVPHAAHQHEAELG